MDFIDQTFVVPVQALVTNSKTLIQRCEKPDYNEFTRSVWMTLIGFAALGLLGVFVKVVFIPINSVIMGK